MSIALLSVALPTNAQVFTEGFDDPSPALLTDVLKSNGWVITNNSSPIGDQNWNQGIPGVQTDGLGLNAESDPPSAANSFIQTNFGAGNPSGAGAIVSDWLVTPVLTLRNGSVVSFYTTANPNVAADPNELQVWLSLSGASTVNVGSTAASMLGGDFTKELLDINPGALLDNGVQGGYPTKWTLETKTISELSGPTVGRIGFRYYLPNNVNEGTTIGIDTLTVTTVPEPSRLALLALGALGFVFFKLREWRLS